MTALLIIAGAWAALSIAFAAGWAIRGVLGRGF